MTTPRIALVSLLCTLLFSSCSCSSKGRTDEDADAAAEPQEEPEPAFDVVEEDPAAPEVPGEPVSDPVEEVEDTVDAEDAAEEEPEAIAGCIEGTFQPYWGNFHAHTSHSDGAGTPAEAFAYARDAAGLDIMAVTDHLEQLYLPTDRWNRCRSAADAANSDGSYVAICGYEYGSAFILPWFWSTGHNNVFFVDYLMPEIQLDFRDFYTSLNGSPDGIGQFNHPGDESRQNWNDFEYFILTDMKMNLFELSGGGSDEWDMLFQALDAGWHVSPMHNQDNHSADWGTDDDTRSGFYMTALTRGDLHDAMRERRSFMTMDLNASLHMMAETTCWMGSILRGITSVSLEVAAEDADTGDGFTTIEIYGPGGALLDSHDCAGADSCTAPFTLDPAPAYVLPRATQTDGDWLSAAPVWVRP
ncbi:MAG: hypothetical protein JRG91_11875 [Deltaproteobacteria bacterium]|nr:hypothetical protein [Deltaproteobacteria bacterium]